MAKAQPNPTAGLYTAMLALTLLAVLATAAFVAYKCQVDYATLFKIAG